MKLAPLAPLLTTALAGTATADTFVASRAGDGDALSIYKLAADGASKVYSEDGRGAYAYAFTGDGALWVLRKDNAGSVTVGKVAGGKAASPRALALADFHITTDPGLPAGMQDPGVLVTRGGQVWATHCTAVVNRGNQMTCSRAYVRVDDGSLTFAASRPASTSFEFGDQPPTPPAIAKPPTGYTAKLAPAKINGTRFTGFTCTGPDHKLAWPGDDVDPQFQPQATKLSWVSAAPPILHAELNGKSPVGEVLHDDLYVIACHLREGDARPLPNGQWLSGGMIVKPDGTTDMLTGTDFVVSP